MIDLASLVVVGVSLEKVFLSGGLLAGSTKRSLQTSTKNSFCCT